MHLTFRIDNGCFAARVMHRVRAGEFFIDKGYLTDSKLVVDFIQKDCTHEVHCLCMYLYVHLFSILKCHTDLIMK